MDSTGGSCCGIGRSWIGTPRSPAASFITVQNLYYQHLSAKTAKCWQTEKHPSATCLNEIRKVLMVSFRRRLRASSLKEGFTALTKSSKAVCQRAVLLRPELLQRGRNTNPCLPIQAVVIRRPRATQTTQSPVNPDLQYSAGTPTEIKL